MNNLFSTANETALLSTLIVYPDKVFELKSLKPEMFSAEPYKELFRVIQELAMRDLTPTKELIISELDSKGLLEKVGGPNTILALATTKCDIGNLREYERLVIDSYKGAKLIQLSGQVPGLVHGGNVDSTIEYIRNSVNELTKESGGDETQKIDIIMQGVQAEILRKINSEEKDFGVRTGFKSVDEQFGGIFPGEVWIIAGRPGMGKSAWLCNSILRTAEAGNPALAFSYEMSKQAISERLVAILSKLSVSDLKLGLIPKDKIEEIHIAVNHIRYLPIFIDTNFAGNLQYLTSTIRKYKSLHDVKIVYVDYLQLLAERDNNATNELGQISRACKLLANDLGIAIVLFSQLNRLVELRDDKRPILPDLRQSGNLEEDSDVISFLYRQDYYDNTRVMDSTLEFIVRKNRTGPGGTLLLNFNLPSNEIISR